MKQWNVIIQTNDSWDAETIAENLVEEFPGWRVLLVAKDANPKVDITTDPRSFRVSLKQ